MHHPITNKKITPKCDFCGLPAVADTKTIHGPWAYVCTDCFNRYSVKIQGLWTPLGGEDSERKRQTV